MNLVDIRKKYCSFASRGTPMYVCYLVNTVAALGSPSNPIQNFTKSHDLQEDTITPTLKKIEQIEEDD